MDTQIKCKNRKLSKPHLSSLGPIGRTLSGATTPGQSGPGGDGKEDVLAFPKAEAILEPHHQIV